MTQSKTGAARRLLSTTTNLNSCSFCTASIAATSTSMLWSRGVRPPTAQSSARPGRPATPATQIRRYAQPATAPLPDAFEESNTKRSASTDAAQFPFPSKKNPSPYEILHLPTTADPKDIKQRCKYHMVCWANCLRHRKTLEQTARGVIRSL